jgi:hypothetical protein
LKVRSWLSAVTLIQGFGSALNLNIHFQVLCLDGAYRFKGAHPPLFRPVERPGANQLQRLIEQIGAQVGEVLERRGLIERNMEKMWLAFEDEAGPRGSGIGRAGRWKSGPARTGQERECPVRPTRGLQSFIRA